MSLLTKFQLRCAEDAEFSKSVLRVLGGPGSGNFGHGSYGAAKGKGSKDFADKASATAHRQVIHAELIKSGFKAGEPDREDPSGMGSSHETTYTHSNGTEINVQQYHATGDRGARSHQVIVNRMRKTP